MKNERVSEDDGQQNNDPDDKDMHAKPAHHYPFAETLCAPQPWVDRSIGHLQLMHKHIHPSEGYAPQTLFSLIAPGDGPFVEPLHTMMRSPFPRAA